MRSARTTKCSRFVVDHGPGRDHADGLSLLSGACRATRLLGLDLAGGIELTYKASPTNEQRKPTDRELQNAIKVINERVNSLGVTEAEVQAAGNELISVSLPDVDDPEAAKALVGSTAQMYFFKWEDNVVGQPGQSTSTTNADSANNKGATKQYDAGIKQYPSAQISLNHEPYKNSVEHELPYLLEKVRILRWAPPTSVAQQVQVPHGLDVRVPRHRPVPHQVVLTHELAECVDP